MNESAVSVLAGLFRHPVRNVVARWNWKSALFSSLFRSGLFFTVNWQAGTAAALGASSAEFCLAALVAGCWGSITQSFRRAEPAWMAALMAVVLMPTLHHTLEFVVHWVRGTPRLGASILASVMFTAFITLFNWFCMRRGVMTVGDGSQTLWHDLRALPSVLVAFVVEGPALLLRGPRDDNR